MIEIKIRIYGADDYEYKEDFIFGGKRYCLETLSRGNYNFEVFYRKILDIPDNVKIRRKKLLKKFKNFRKQSGIKISESREALNKYVDLIIQIN